ncbi:hypothetical protein FRC01_011436, partial [Tulasnella sp. 417]
PKYKLKHFEKLKNVTIHDTDFTMSFTPPFAWQKIISNTTSAMGAQTFHAISNELAYYSRPGSTAVTEFSAQCAALAIYGASPAQLKAAFPGGFRHGHTQICLGQFCDYVDVHHAYLNIPLKLWNEPVLLYNTDRMWPKAVEAVTIRLLGPLSPVAQQWIMSFSHAVCSQIVPKRPKSNIRDFTTALLSAVALLSSAIIVAGYRVTLFLFSTAQWRFPWAGPKQHPPLNYGEHSAPPSYVSYDTMDSTPDPPPPEHDPITQPALPPKQQGT